MFVVVWPRWFFCPKFCRDDYSSQHFAAVTSRSPSPRRGLSQPRIFNRIFAVSPDVAMLEPKISALETTPGVCAALCFFFLLFSFFFVSGLTACFDRGEREYCPGGTSFSHSIVDDRFVLCFRAQPIAVGFRRQYDKPRLSVPHRGTHTGAHLAKNMSHLLLPCLPP